MLFFSFRVGNIGYTRRILQNNNHYVRYTVYPIPFDSLSIRKFVVRYTIYVILGRMGWGLTLYRPLSRPLTFTLQGFHNILWCLGYVSRGFDTTTPHILCPIKKKEIKMGYYPTPVSCFDFYYKGVGHKQSPDI